MISNLWVGFWQVEAAIGCQATEKNVRE
jgi:hypothetical protein